VSETRKVTRTVTEYQTLNSTYQLDELAKEWRRVTGTNPALQSQGEDGEWKPYHSADHVADVLYLYHPNGMFRTSTLQSVQLVALTE
jgi:hypothetical protein